MTTMDPRANFDRLVASITFSGSLLSFLATTAVLISYVYYRNEQRSFRHALIFNLALAEFINTLNNTISGIIFLRDHALYPCTACTINGFVGQLSVQASDFSILVIAIITLLTITRTTYMPAASTQKKVGICLSVWVVPVITATIATARGNMGPVSGNWCWIMREHTDMRYALTHGWRIAIIFFTTGIYIFVWWYMKRHFRSIVDTLSDDSTTQGSWLSRKRKRGFRRMDGVQEQVMEVETELSMVSKSRISRVGVDKWELSAPEAAFVRSSMDEGHREDLEANFRRIAQDYKAPRRTRRRPSVSSLSSNEEPQIITMDKTGLPGARDGKMQPDYSAMGTVETTASEFPTRRRTRQMEREIKRMLLLNAYPIMYVILWIPGLTNRFLEASGNRSSSRVLAALQSSSQFVGLANALTYGFDTALRKKFRNWWRSRKRDTPKE